MLSEAAASEPGRLDRRLVLEKPAGAGDGAGGRVIAWSAAGILWAEMRLLGADERPVGEGLAEMRLYRIVMRHRDDVATGDRFRLGERTFLVLATSDPGGDRRFLACLAEEEGGR